MRILCKTTETVNEFIDAIRIRVDVFIIEQKCPPGWEPDEFDKKSQHFIALVDNIIVATARLRKESKQIVKIERMAVKKNYRGKGIGEKLTKHLIQEAKKMGYKKIMMQAQSYAQDFYKKSGFHTVSEEYDLFDLGILHVDMEYELQ